MSVNIIEPFIASVCGVMPQLGFSTVQPGEPTVVSNKVIDTGVIIVIGIVGDVKGNIAYKLDYESAFKIASIMMMCDPLTELDDIAQSALGELANMLTANAATEFSNIGINADISTPTMLQGNNVTLKMSTENITNIRFAVDDIFMDINISLENQ